MRSLLLSFTFLMLTSCYLTDEVRPDQKTWEYGRPSAEGLSESTLYNLDTEIEEGKYDQITGFMIVRNDKIVFENTYRSNNRNELRKVGRATNIMTIMMMDYFISNGYFQLDDPIYTFLPEYEALFEAEPAKKQITFRHLISNKSGLIWNETHVNSQRFESDIYQMKQTADWTNYILSKPLEADPGLRTVINSGCGVILSKIYQNLIEKDLLALYEELFFEPLNITGYDWEMDAEGTLNGANGLSLSLIDFAKMGYLTLLEGRWLDKKRIVSRDWILDMTSEQQQLSTDCSLGFGYWLLTVEFQNRYLNSSGPVFFIHAEGGQGLYVLPRRNMVIAVQAENPFYHRLFNPSMFAFVSSLQSLNGSTLN